MILVLKTGTNHNLLELRTATDGKVQFTKSWPASKQLSEELPGIIEDALADLSLEYSDLTGIVGFSGPGSYTGLRIGITVINTIADQSNIPIIGISSQSSENNEWIGEGLAKLNAGQNDQLIMPEYGGEANITKPRK